MKVSSKFIALRRFSTRYVSTPVNKALVLPNGASKFFILTFAVDE
jgi:hypothetical protein